ncbi:viroplasmin family protein [Desulfitobacterium metallireducens]|uniref:ribonuclease H n=1 Tax=Desulfitobacterium metallireducens DSM 15288 TaxID=871968 RepID=W0ECP9_9FIRM|nr:ribonuclease H family protein [Desulfitobacterium metallireducens]AHF06979.1 double-stranded DNA-binding protein [Desulfitobacterium metallireducens DSM 15288]
MPTKKPKFYAVKVGRESGIFLTWAACKNAVHGFPGAIYRSFESESEAQDWFNDKRSELRVNSHPVDYEVYTDGSYLSGQYSWAYAFVKNDEVIYEDSSSGTSPEAAVMRNVAGEIAAVIYAVKRAADLGVTIRIFHDYAGIAFWVTGEWRAKNEFTQRYAKLMNEYRGVYVFEKVKAHTGNKFNEYVDKKAKAALGIT